MAEQDERSFFVKYKNKLIAGTVVGTTAVVVPPVGLYILGFKASGIVAGSTAAWLMSKLGTIGIISMCQSAGAAGIGIGTSVATFLSASGLSSYFVKPNKNKA